MNALSGGSMFVAGFVVVLLGAIYVRKAHATSGYLFMGAGAVVMLFRCCFGPLTYETLLDGGMDFDVVNIVMLMRSLVGAAHVVIVGALFAASFVMLAKQVQKGPD